MLVVMGLAELLRMPRLGAPAPRVTPAERLRALLEGHFDFIGRSLRRLGVPEADVDDATQQVFLVASKRLEEILPGREKSFLFGVALRVAADTRRAQRRRTAVMDDRSESPDAPSEAAGPDQMIDERRTRQLLDEALNHLPIELRTVFVLYELEEMTMADIAHTLELPPGTVASRLRRAREMFHEQARRLRAAHERSAT